jgi:tetratricopeptide (TPR) repeat protein
VSRFRAWLGDLPRAARWSLWGAAAFLALVILASAGWTWLQQREARAQQALTPIAETATQLLAGGTQQADLEAVSERLKGFLSDHPRARVSAEGWYLLGNVQFRLKNLDAALVAYGEAVRHGSPSIAALAGLDLGYAREAKGDLKGALDAFNQTLAGRTPRDFLYGELLVAKGRILEQTGDKAGAIETYRRFLKDLPSSGRLDEIRARLGFLGASA